MKQPHGLSLVMFDSIVVGTGSLIDDSLAYSAQNLECIWTSFGGCWSLSFQYNGNRERVEDWLDAGLGRHIEFFDPALDRIWSGFVNKVTINIGSLSKSRGPLTDVANKIKVIYSTVDTSVSPPVVGVRDDTDWAGDSDSQNKYGIWEHILSVGGARVSRAEQIRDVALEDMSFPQSDETDNLTDDFMPSASIECLGYYHWMKAYTVDLTTTGLQNADAKLQAVLAADPNSVFSTDYSYIESNTTQVGAYDRDFRIASTVVKGLVALGDASGNRWTFGFDADRKPFFRAVDNTPYYERRLASPNQPLELYGTGNVVEPWKAEPARWVAYSDFLIGRTQSDNIRTDPRYLFIEEVTFRAPFGLTLRGSRISRLDQVLAQLGLGGTHA